MAAIIPASARAEPAAHMIALCMLPPQATPARPDGRGERPTTTSLGCLLPSGQRHCDVSLA
jgi:hypothetical protein